MVLGAGSYQSHHLALIELCDSGQVVIQLVCGEHTQRAGAQPSPDSILSVCFSLAVSYLQPRGRFSLAALLSSLSPVP